MTVASDRISMDFNRSGATQPVALDISKAFDSVWDAGLLKQAEDLLYFWFDFLVYFAFSPQLMDRTILDGKSSEKYPANAGVPRWSILGYISFLLCTNNLPNTVIFNIACYV